MNYDPYSRNQVRFLRSDPTARYIPLYTQKETKWDVKVGYILAAFIILLLI